MKNNRLIYQLHNFYFSNSTRKLHCDCVQYNSNSTCAAATLSVCQTRSTVNWKFFGQMRIAVLNKKLHTFCNYWSGVLRSNIKMTSLHK